MRLSRRGALAIIAHEGIVQTRYRDSVGVWTIGIGVTAAAKAGINPRTYRGKLSIGECVDLFMHTVKKYERGVNRAMGAQKLKQHEFDALVSFHYNTGKISRCSATRAIRRGKRGAQIGRLLKRWNRAGGRVSKALVARRALESAMFVKGRYPRSNKATVYRATNSGRVKWGSAKRISLDQYLEAPTALGLVSTMEADMPDEISQDPTMPAMDMPDIPMPSASVEALGSAESTNSAFDGATVEADVPQAKATSQSFEEAVMARLDDLAQRLDAVDEQIGMEWVEEGEEGYDDLEDSPIGLVGAQGFMDTSDMSEVFGNVGASILEEVQKIEGFSGFGGLDIFGGLLPNGVNAKAVAWLIRKIKPDPKFLLFIQKVLKELGYYEGKLDGKLGFKTSFAVSKFKRDKGLPDANGDMDEGFLTKLMSLSL